MRIVGSRCIWFAVVTASAFALMSIQASVAAATAVQALTTEPLMDFRKDVVQLLLAGDYDALDATHDALEDGDEFFSNGESRLSVFYGSLLRRTPDGTDVSMDAMRTLRPERILALQAWLKAKPHSDATRTTLASSLEDRAFDLRGYGYVDQVTQSQLQDFSEKMTEAIDTLNGLEHWDPMAYATAIDMATITGTPRNEEDDLFAQAVKAFPDYPEIYQARTTALLPKWGGSPTDACDFAATLKKSLDDTAILNYSIVAEAMVEPPEQIVAMVKASCLNWPLVRASFEHRASVRGLDNKDGNMYLAFSAAMLDRYAAGRAAPYATAYDPRYWGSVDEYNYFRSWPTQVGGPNNPPEPPSDIIMVPSPRPDQ